eukprot:TRINITY_DN6318_c0_g1_i2.p1 TRINITY_DN6318_c0_g1~~TRINITY_DN6318_c0_g1_i2.p1  ORF type:complete len:116 (-),score=6.36 TRINITY_DN6318_c0_g1_i2:63-410(-)
MYPQIEEKLFEWFIFQRKRKIAISFKMLQETASQLATELKIEGSILWVQNFEKRYNLKSRSVTKVPSKAGHQIKPLVGKFFNVINSVRESYDESHIWNYDEVPFYFELPQSKRGK